MNRISISSWSLHRSLGRPPLYGPGAGPQGPTDRAETALLDLPSQLAQMEIHTLEIVHFHLSSTAPGYLEQLRAAMDEAGVALFSILVDAGDITHPDLAQRRQELAWIQSWIDVAAALGAACVRVVAGYTPVGNTPVGPTGTDLRDHPVLRLSAENLLGLAVYAGERGVRVMTENFRETAGSADQVLALLDLCQGQVGLCADFGNFKGETRIEELAAIFPRADSAHAKAEYWADGRMDRANLQHTLALLTRPRDDGQTFDGPISLIYDGPLQAGETEWDHLAILRDVVAGYV